MKNIDYIVLSVALVSVLLYAAVIEGQKISFNESYEPVQPINFSHKVHAGDNQINCQYCHFASEQGRHAGIPPTSLCLNCHEVIKKDSPEILKIRKSIEDKNPIEWVKVHHLPDFAYFNHSQHVNVGKISCQTCHGSVEKMDIVKQENSLNMGWCIDCHRGSSIAPPDDHKSRAGGDCAKCHY